MSEGILRLAEDTILLEMTAKNKEGALQELAAVLQQKCPQVSLEAICRVLRERELIGSTGVGNGVAIPHGRVEGLSQILFCLGRSLDGISFDAIDNQPVHYFFLILSPLNVANEYLQTLARASRLLKQPEKRRLLRLATTKEEVSDIFGQAE
ncbi:MAG: PTS sugar transporter subunit IIA [Desulfobulbaceae bacterium]